VAGFPALIREKTKMLKSVTDVFSI